MRRGLALRSWTVGFDSTAPKPAGGRDAVRIRFPRDSRTHADAVAAPGSRRLPLDAGTGCPCWMPPLTRCAPLLLTAHDGAQLPAAVPRFLGPATPRESHLRVSRFAPGAWAESVPRAGRQYSRIPFSPGIGWGYLPSGPAWSGAGDSKVSRSTSGANSWSLLRMSSYFTT